LLSTTLVQLPKQNSGAIGLTPRRSPRLRSLFGVCDLYGFVGLQGRRDLMLR
jgi:hypothetical protein